MLIKIMELEMLIKILREKMTVPGSIRTRFQGATLVAAQGLRHPFVTALDMAKESKFRHKSVPEVP